MRSFVAGLSAMVVLSAFGALVLDRNQRLTLDQSLALRSVHLGE